MIKTITTKWDGDLTINAGEHVSFSGMVNGNVYALNNSKLDISGMVNGNIKVSPSSEVKISGMVNGQIINEGTLYVSGMINNCPAPIHGNVIFAPGSYLNGIKL